MALKRIVVLGALALPLSCPRDPPPDAGADAQWEHPQVDSGATSDGRLHLQISDGMRGHGIPCKLTVIGVDGTATPLWGADSQHGAWLDREDWALGSGRWVMMARGRATIVVGEGPTELPPGRYRLSVTRGNEYAALALGEVTVDAVRGALVQGDLRRVIETEGEVAGEFHVHSAPSFDSEVALDERVVSLAAEGVEVFASTDHDAAAEWGPTIALLGLEQHIHWMRGDEITADGFGHFGAYPLPENVDPATDLPHTESSVAQIIARAREVAPSAVMQLNHPLWSEHPIGAWALSGFDPSTGRSRMELNTHFDAVEVFNSHTLDEYERVSAPVDRVIDAWMTTLDQGRGATATGNTDTHRLAKTPPGWPRTFLRVGTDDPGSVTDAMVTGAILAGDAMLTSGPHLRATIGAARPGAIASAAAGEVLVSVEVQSPTFAPVERVEVIANHVMVAARDVNAMAVNGVRRQRFEVPVRLSRDAWIVVRTRAEMPIDPNVGGDHNRPLPSLALVNPIYVDVDGDGRWTAPGPHTGP